MAMTEVNLSDDTLPSIARFTLDASTANKAHQINLRAADSATKVTVRFDDNDGKVAFETSGDSIHANHIVITKDSPTEISIAPGPHGNRVSVFYVASATTSTAVSIVCECGP